MVDPTPRARGRSPLLAWLPVLVLLTPAVVLPLVVPVYDREDPSFAGFPFYFWFQFLLIIVAVILTVTAYLLVGRVDRAERVRHGLPPTAPPAPAERDRSARTTRETEGGAR